MSVFIIPRSQTLRFVQVTPGTNFLTANYINTQNFDNRLLLDEKWQTPETKNEYLQKFNLADPLLFQFTTDYDISKIDITVCNNKGTVLGHNYFDTSIIYTYSDGSGNVVYNMSLSRYKVLNGFYFVKIQSNDLTKPPISYISESFEYSNKYANLPYIKWQGSDRDGIFWDDANTTIFGIRAELRLRYVPNLEASVYEGFKFQPETLFSVSKRGVQLNGDPMPRFIVEKLKLAFDHFNVWINNVPVNSNGATPKITAIDNSNYYDFDHLVLETEYEDYSVLQEISGTVIAVDDGLIDNDNIELIDNDGFILIG
jgi:hypothetical protein